VDEPEPDLVRLELDDLLVPRELDPDLVLPRELDPDLFVPRELDPDLLVPRELDPDLLVPREPDRLSPDEAFAAVGFFERGPLKTSSNLEYSRSLS
jgi:hypothetical protein